MIGPHESGYRWNRSAYAKYYQDTLGLIDIGHELSKGDLEIRMDGDVHMANEGGLVLSILVGRVLKRPLQCNHFGECRTCNLESCWTTDSKQPSE